MGDNPFVLDTDTPEDAPEDLHAHLVTAMQALRASDPLRFAAVLQTLELAEAGPGPEIVQPEPEPEPAPAADQPPPGPDAA